MSIHEVHWFMCRWLSSHWYAGRFVNCFGSCCPLRSIFDIVMESIKTHVYQLLFDIQLVWLYFIWPSLVKYHLIMTILYTFLITRHNRQYEMCIKVCSAVRRLLVSVRVTHPELKKVSHTSHSKMPANVFKTDDIFTLPLLFNSTVGWVLSRLSF